VGLALVCCGSGVGVAWVWWGFGVGLKCGFGMDFWLCLRGFVTGLATSLRPWVHSFLVCGFGVGLGVGLGLR
jgi:hypothetical protein